MAIGRTNAGAGGSGGVNFKVVGGTTEPASPKENTIWVNTSVTIPSWVFSATEPGSPVEGMVWISTGTNSTVTFNALKKNDVQVYPQSAKQYVGGAWVSVDAKTYQGGEWVDWAFYLYKSGDTDGWKQDTTSGFTVEFQEDCLYSSFSKSCSNAAYNGNLSFNEAVDLTNAKTITLNMKSGWLSALPGNSSDDFGNSVKLVVLKNSSQVAIENLIRNHTTSAKTFSSQTFVIDVSGLSGECQVAIRHSVYAYKTAGTVTTKIYISEITVH